MGGFSAADGWSKKNIWSIEIQLAIHLSKVLKNLLKLIPFNAIKRKYVKLISTHFFLF